MTPRAHNDALASICADIAANVAAHASQVTAALADKDISEFLHGRDIGKALYHAREMAEQVRRLLVLVEPLEKFLQEEA